MFDLIPDIIPEEKKAIEPPDSMNDYDEDDDFDDDEDQNSLQSLLIRTTSAYN